MTSSGSVNAKSSYGNDRQLVGGVAFVGVADVEPAVVLNRVGVAKVNSLGRNPGGFLRHRPPDDKHLAELVLARFAHGDRERRAAATGICGCGAGQITLTGRKHSCVRLAGGHGKV